MLCYHINNSRKRFISQVYFSTNGASFFSTNIPVCCVVSFSSPCRCSNISTQPSMAVRRNWRKLVCTTAVRLARCWHDGPLSTKLLVSIWYIYGVKLLHSRCSMFCEFSSRAAQKPVRKQPPENFWCKCLHSAPVQRHNWERTAATCRTILVHPLQAEIYCWV